MKNAVWILSGLLVGLSPGAALAQSLGVVTAYNAETLRTYDADGGRRSAATLRSDLPSTPVQIVAVQSGGRIGILDRNNQRIFLRGLDVEFQLNEAGRAAAECRPVASANRAPGAVVAGTRAGGGSSTDCASQGGQ